MNTRWGKAAHTTGSEKLGTEETYEVIPLLAAPLPVTPLPARMEPSLRTTLWLVALEPKETSVSLAGFQVSMRLWGRRAFAGNRFQPHSELFFSFPILLQMSKLFTLHWHPKMILLLPWLQLKQYFFMLHRLPTSWLKTRNVTGHSISTCHEKKNKEKR